MLKKLILIENGEEVQCDNLESVVKNLLDEDFYNLKEEEKIKKMKMKAMANIFGSKMEIVEDISNLNMKELDGKFIIKDEITYILSLLTINKVLLLENKDSNIFTKDLDKSQIENNYIIVNTYAKDLLDKYIGK